MFFDQEPVRIFFFFLGAIYPGVTSAMEALILMCGNSVCVCVCGCVAVTKKFIVQ